jgi:hypothetical protein
MNIENAKPVHFVAQIKAMRLEQIALGHFVIPPRLEDYLTPS